MYDCMCINFVWMQLRVHRYDNTHMHAQLLLSAELFWNSMWELSEQSDLHVGVIKPQRRTWRCCPPSRPSAWKTICWEVSMNPASSSGSRKIQHMMRSRTLELKFKWKSHFLPKLGYSYVLILQYYYISSKMEWFVKLLLRPSQKCTQLRFPGFERPSAVQQRAILPILQGRDVIVQSPRGTGHLGC